MVRAADSSGVTTTWAQNSYSSHSRRWYWNQFQPTNTHAVGSLSFFLFLQNGSKSPLLKTATIDPRKSCESYFRAKILFFHFFRAHASLDMWAAYMFVTTPFAFVFALFLPVSDVVLQPSEFDLEGFFSLYLPPFSTDGQVGVRVVLSWFAYAVSWLSTSRLVGMHVT